MAIPITLVISLILVANSPVAQVTGQVSCTGWITDTLCGSKGANAQHVECAKRTVASGKAKFALYDEARKKLYILEPQETAAAYFGQRVKVTGTLSFTSVQRAGEWLDAKTKQVVAHAKALDSSTPIGGIITISSVEVVPSPAARE